MAPDTPPSPRMQHVATAGTALAVTLAPLVIGVLLAKTMATDPMTPVNAMVTRGGQPVLIPPAQWRRCGRHALRRWKGPLDACKRPGVLVQRCPGVRRPRRPGVLLREH
ncbi:hypothetical protein [Streptomyces atratus]|uniref:Uncharacterized protein n=1 Tax=Streptomyces atratus TaxID=1893 RepID=A0A2Z5JLY6_STRAR|nr:hypothetical protein [Streptomyces atratus]AXE81486.1 hypothetical protein C5746_36180 [Streptomyces atratus]